MAKELNMTPLICLYFIAPKKMTFIDLSDNRILFSTHPEFPAKQIAKFNCYDKEKWSWLCNRYVYKIKQRHLLLLSALVKRDFQGPDQEGVLGFTIDLCFV